MDSGAAPLIYLLVFPGLVFSALAGGFYSWEIRKIRARLQARRGPPWYQPYADVIKLLSKETIVPATANRAVFMAMPIISLAALLCITMMLQVVEAPPPPLAFAGDAIVVLYLLAVPSVALALFGAAAGSPYAYLGAGREVAMAVSYDLPLIISLLGVWSATGSLSVSGVAAYQQEAGWLIVRSPFTAILAVTFFASMAGKLGIKPFDVPDARQEVIAGPLTEASGSVLAVFELSRMLRLFVVTTLFVDLFLGGGGGGVPGLVIFLLKSLGVVAAAALLDTLSARFRPVQAFKFYLIGMTPLSAVGLVGVTLAGV